MSLLDDPEDLRLDLLSGMSDEKADRIVAALEAAEKTLHSLEHFPLSEEHVRTGYAQHVLDGMKRELNAALQGEKVTP